MWPISAPWAWWRASSSARAPGAAGARGYETYLKCFHDGLLVRVTGDIIALSPPLILERQPYGNHGRYT